MIAQHADHHVDGDADHEHSEDEGDAVDDDDDDDDDDEDDHDDADGDGDDDDAADDADVDEDNDHDKDDDDDDDDDDDAALSRHAAFHSETHGRASEAASKERGGSMGCSSTARSRCKHLVHVYMSAGNRLAYTKQ
eukprot:12411072-Karenia_brevis.AAC.2